MKWNNIITIYEVHQGELYSLDVKETPKCYVPLSGNDFGVAFGYRSRFNKEYDRVFLTPDEAIRTHRLGGE